MTLPDSYETMVAFYNPQTLDRLGLRPPTTLEEFEGFCTEVAGRGAIPLTAGNAEYRGANEWFVGIALNHGAGPDAVYSALRGETKWTDPVFVDAIDRLASWFERGWFGGGVDRYFTNGFSTMYRQLADGEAALMMSGSWELPNFAPYFGAAAGNDQSWDFAPVPALGAGVPPVVWDLAVGQSAGVNTNFGDEAAAVDYLDFFTTDVPTIVASVEQMNFAPPPLRLRSSDFTANADPRTVRLYSGLAAATTIGYATWTFFPQQTETYLIDYFENVITGQLGAAEYCAGIQERFAKELALGRVPTAPKPNGGLG